MLFYVFFFSVSSCLCTVIGELNFCVLFRGQGLGVLETVINTLKWTHFSTAHRSKM